MKPDSQDWSRGDLGKRLESGWGIDPESLIEVRIGANNVYRAQRDGHPVYVKVTAGTIRPESDVAGSTAYLQHLGDRGAPVSKLILRENGRRYEIMPHEERSYYISVAEAAVGEGIDLHCKDPKVFAAWGTALAGLHKAAEEFDSAPWDYLKGDDEWERIQTRCADEPPEILGRIDEIGSWRESLARPEKGFPLTHGDMNAGNVIIDGGIDGYKATLIDFDEPMYIWNAADIARPFCETWEQSDRERHENFDAFFNAYSKIRTPEPGSPRDYENFMTLKKLEGYGWFLKVWEAEEAFGEKVDETVARLREMILNPLSLG